MKGIIGTEILMSDRPEAEWPKLPDGWRYRAEIGRWLMAISPTGDMYYVGPLKLYPRGWRQSSRTFFVDTQNGVIELTHGN